MPGEHKASKSATKTPKMKRIPSVQGIETDLAKAVRPLLMCLDPSRPLLGSHCSSRPIALVIVGVGMIVRFICSLLLVPAGLEL